MKFMILGAPRSGTAWTANWLSWPNHLCLHDPLWDSHYLDLDLLNIAGVSCTGLGYFPKWVNRHPAKKVILRRDPAEVNSSLRRLGLAPVPMAYFESLASVQGLHVLWSDLFKQDWAMKVWLELGLGTFDTVRWDQARKMRVTSIIGSRKQNMAVMRRLKAENPLL